MVGNRQFEGGGPNSGFLCKVKNEITNSHILILCQFFGDYHYSQVCSVPPPTLEATTFYDYLTSGWPNSSPSFNLISTGLDGII